MSLVLRTIDESDSQQLRKTALALQPQREGIMKKKVPSVDLATNVLRKPSVLNKSLLKLKFEADCSNPMVRFQDDANKPTNTTEHSLPPFKGPSLAEKCDQQRELERHSSNSHPKSC